MKTAAATLCAVALLAAAGPALAHGKAGLWRVRSTTDMTMKGVTPAGAQSRTTHMCMSQEEVDTDTPPHIDQTATGCESHVTSVTPSSLNVTTVCDGSLKGKGHMQIVYRTPEHYAGTYSFTGAVEGNQSSMTTSFRGDWLKADCGDVKPYKLRTQ